MQTIFDIFDARTGINRGQRHTERRALETVKRCSVAGHVFDYLPAKREGLYVVTVGEGAGAVVAGPFKTRQRADARCMVENQASNRRTFAVCEHSL